MAKLETEIDVAEEALEKKENELSSGTYTTGSTVPQLIKEINKDKKYINGLEKDLAKEKKKGIDTVKVEIYYTKDKKGSKKTKQFTYGTGGLT